MIVNMVGSTFIEQATPVLIELLDLKKRFREMNLASSIQKEDSDRSLKIIHRLQVPHL